MKLHHYITIAYKYRSTLEYDNNTSLYLIPYIWAHNRISLFTNPYECKDNGNPKDSHKDKKFFSGEEQKYYFF